MRRLSAEEEALWAKVAATIRPLSRDRTDIAVVASKPEQKAPPAAKDAGPVPRRSQAAPPAIPLSNRTLDGSWDRKLGKGAVSPDRVIDLHGHNLDRAWSAIDHGLERAIAHGERVVLLITGHRRQGDEAVSRGKIRASVEDWLAASRHAPQIASVRNAHARHGGGGSLYLILRRG